MNDHVSIIKHEKKLKVFGPNTSNFYGWVFTGMIVIAFAIYQLILVGQSSNVLSALNHGFTAIITLLIGIFGLLLQSYHSELSQHLFKNDNSSK
jgi:hypothetical protein